jgi:hypothetical protein
MGNKIKNYRDFLKFKKSTSLIKEQIQHLGDGSKIKTFLLIALWFLPLGMLWVLLVVFLQKKIDNKF